MKLTFKEKWMKFWGLGYVVNLRKASREIHRLSHKHVSCNRERMTNYKFVTKRKALRLLEQGYDGCRYCWTERNTG